MWLDAWHMKKIVNKEGQNTEVADYTGRVLQMPIGELAARIPRGDPRRDDWTESIESWFSGRVGGVEYEVWYVKDGLPSRLLPAKFQAECSARNIVEVLTGGGRSQSAALACRLAALAAGLSLVFMFKGKRRWLALAMALPWMLFAVLADAWYASFGLGALAFLPFAVEGLAVSAFSGAPTAEGEGPRRLLYHIFPLALPLYAALLFDPRAASSFFALALASLSLSLLAMDYLSAIGRRHFYAIPITAGRSSVLRPLKPVTAALSLFLALVAMLPAAVGRGPSQARSGPAAPISIPEPIWKTPATGVREGSRLPGLEAWRNHVANEEVFFTSPLRSAEEGATIPTRSPSFSGRPPPAFRAMTGGIESVLADQSGAQGFTMGSPANAGSGPLALWRLILYIIGPIIVIAGAGKLQPRAGGRRVTIHER